MKEFVNLVRMNAGKFLIRLSRVAAFSDGAGIEERYHLK